MEYEPRGVYSKGGVFLNCFRVAIIVLNWNNPTDTIACLESIEKQSYTDYTVFLIDNGSTDKSSEILQIRIKDIFKQGDISILNYHLNYEEEIAITDDVKNLHRKKIVFLLNRENMGFAKGNNLGIKYVLHNGHFDYLFLLNNDTVLEKNCIEELLNEVGCQSEIMKIAVPQIRFFNEPDTIWNCGGKLYYHLGIRKYFFAKKNKSLCPKKNFQVSFVTGCALLIHAEIFKRVGLLTEKFFFGEEDWDFSLRMKENKIKMYCIPNAVLFHKVSRTANVFFTKSHSLKVCLCYINRMVNLKSKFKKTYWLLWREIYFLYIRFLLFKNSFLPRDIRKIVHIIRYFSGKLEFVKRGQVEQIRECVNKTFPPVS